MRGPRHVQLLLQSLREAIAATRRIDGLEPWPQDAAPVSVARVLHLPHAAHTHTPQQAGCCECAHAHASWRHDGEEDQAAS